MKMKTFAYPYAMLMLLCLTSLIADEFPFKPPANFTLKPTFIGLHHPVTTNQTLAQLYFDQGLTLIYAFNHDAAYWSFLKASEVDPHLAMAYWGIALALGSNINMEITPTRAKVAYDAIQKAIQLAPESSENERDYIQALAHRYSDDPEQTSHLLAKRYSQAMRQLSDKYPEDLDAAVLFVESILDITPWNQWSLKGEPLSRTLEAVKKLESVLKKDPNHLGANHYYIHAIEASPYPERALVSAERLKKLLPSSGHILHMPSHIFLLVGDYHRAAQANEEAVVVDREYINEYGIQGIYPVHYLSHNLYFLARAYAMEGRLGDAKRAANDLAAFYLPHFDRMPELEYYVPALMFILLRFNQWQDVLKLPQPLNSMQVSQVLWHFGRGLAFASLGNVTQALREQDLFFKGQANVKPGLDYGYNKVEKILKIAELSLAAKIAEAQQNLTQAIDSLQEAIQTQDTLRYNEPPDWFFPIRESLGGLLLRMQRPREAEFIFREDLEKHPRNGRSLFGLKESLKMQSKANDFYWVNQEFQKAWLYSDIQLTIDNL